MNPIASAQDFKALFAANAAANVFDVTSNTMHASLLTQLNAQYDAAKQRYRIDMGNDTTLTLLSKVQFAGTETLKVTRLTFRKAMTNYKGKLGLNFDAGASFITLEAM